MAERRLEPRMLCADLIDVQWKDRAGRSRAALANLEDISASGACLQMDVPVPVETLLRIGDDRAGFEGTVRYCVYRETGYFVGVRFAPGVQWSRAQFKPKHLFDPRRLVALSTRRGRKTPPQNSGE